MHRQHPFGSVATELDRLLELVAMQLQLTATQYQEAERSYRAVGEWLSAPGSRLHSYAPDIIPQGSMALGTTVKPRRREEFDVDLVCRMELDRTRIGPTQVYRMVADRIREHATYRAMLTLKDRCLRLDYAGQFHLDVIPAAPDPRFDVPCGSLSLVIPDKQQACWVPTNPEGFREWFQSRAVVPDRGLIRLSVEPLPPHEERGSKTVLQRVVQLFKRRRDVHFNGNDFEPRSILITTVDGMLYAGQQSLSYAVNSILDGLIAWGAQYRGAAPPIIPNPTNADENLARHWREDAHSNWPGFGETGLIVIGRRKKGKIRLLFRHRHRSGAEPDSVPFDSECHGAGPIRPLMGGLEPSNISLTVFRQQRPASLL